MFCCLVDLVRVRERFLASIQKIPLESFPVLTCFDSAAIVTYSLLVCEPAFLIGSGLTSFFIYFYFSKP